MDSNAANDEQAKMWERPWTVDEMHQNAANWSLAGDSGMLNHIQDFSKRLLARVHDTNQLMDNLVHDTKLASVRVDNAFNDFIMLANTQFVENRVFDDDVTQEPEPEKKTDEEKSREQKESELVDRVKSAIQHGLAVVDDMFEIVHVDIGADSDSEEDEAPNEAIMKVKNPYTDRPLPHLIGTQAFMSDDFVGLKEESSSEESEEEEEEETESEESDKKSESEYSDDMSEPEKQEIIPRKNTHKRQPSSSSSGDLFGDKSEDEDEDYEEHNNTPPEDAKPKPGAGGGFASELAKRIGAAPPVGQNENTESDDDWDDQPKKSRAHSKSSSDGKPAHKETKTKAKHKETTSQKKSKPVEEDDNDMFPPEDDGQMTWNAGGGLFSGGGLFDDEPGGGLFDDLLDTNKSKPKENEVKKKEEPAPSKAKPAGPSLFDDEDDLFAEPAPKAPEPKKAAPPPKQAPPAAKKPSLGADLFGEDSDEDLFAKPKQKEEKKAKVGGLFEDEKEDLFAAPKPTPPSAEKKKPSLAGAVPMFGAGTNPLSLAIANRRPKSDDEASDDNRSTSSSMTSSRLAAGKQERSPSVSSNSNSLFADEPEDPLPTKLTSKPKVAAIFDDDDEGDDDGDLFSSAPASNQSQARKPRAPSLFIENDDEEDLFAAPKPKAKVETKPAAEPAKAAVKSKPLFSPDEPDGGLFGSGKAEKTTSSQSQKADPALAKKKSVTISLFDDGDDDDMGSDLFAPAPKTSEKSKSADGKLATEKPSTKPRKSLFADDDVLFGSADDDPNIDLFGPTSPITPTQSSAPKFPSETTKPAPTKPTASPLTKDAPAPAPAAKSPSAPAPAAKAPSAPITVAPAQAPAAVFPPLPLDGATTAESDDVTPVNTTDDVDSRKPSVSPSRGGFKPPVGGVSLFGGVDVLGIQQKRRSMFNDEEKSEDSHVATNGTAHDVATANDVGPARDLAVSPISPSSSRKREEESAVSFEEPAKAETLHSLNKGRAKITAKRRPPTRRGRQSKPDAPALAPEPETRRPTLLEIANDTSPVAPSNGQESNRLPAHDVMDNNVAESPDDLFQSKSSAQTSSISHKTNSAAATTKENDILSEKSDDSSDLFTKSARKTNIFGSPDDGDDIFASKPKKTAKIEEDEDDLFGTNQAKDSKKSKSSTKAVFDDSPTDIFNSPKLKPPPSTDDIFSTPSATVSTKKDAFQSDSDDDIFKTEAKTKSKAKDPFEDDDEDIFSTPSKPSAPSSAPAPAPAARDDDDIFRDDTDIFADIPPKSSKPRKSRDQGSLFNDDVDDIFSTPPSKTKTTKPKSTAAKKKTKGTSQQSAASIFDKDAPSIFDDPLSALK